MEEVVDCLCGKEGWVWERGKGKGCSVFREWLERGSVRNIMGWERLVYMVRRKGLWMEV